jgi:hypothetical protein
VHSETANVAQGDRLLKVPVPLGCLSP